MRIALSGCVARGAALVVIAGLMAVVLPAELSPGEGGSASAETPSALTSNLDQNSGGYASFGSNDLAQPFFVGGFRPTVVTSVAISVTDAIGVSDLPSLMLVSGSATGTQVATFDPPSNVASNDHQRYTPSSSVTLDGSTTYWLVAEGGTGKWTTTGAGEDTNAPGWHIGDKGESRAASSTAAFAQLTGTDDAVFKLRVEGHDLCGTDVAVSIPDTALRGWAEEQLEKPAGAEITASEMRRLTLLILPDSSVSDLTGLVCADRLSYVLLSGNDVSDISPLFGMADLRLLDLRGNSLSGAVDFAGLPDLTILDLNDNALTSVDVSALTDLVTLDLAHNSLTSIEVSANTELTSLYVANNNLTSLSVANLIDLVLLDLANNSVSSLSVAGLTDLVTLNLRHNSVSSLDVSASTGLESLNLSYNDISSLDVSSNTELMRLYVAGNSLTALDVTGLTKLESLVTRLARSAITGLTETASDSHVGTSYFHNIGGI